MTKGKNRNVCRNFMYEQQVMHLPNSMSPDEMYAHIQQNLKPKRIAFILHDKDLKDDNKTPAEDHLHIMLQFENARSVNQLAKDIGDKPQQFTIWRDRVENGFSYLIHATANARHKFQYSASEVRANFDYVDYISKISKKVDRVSEITSAQKINSILDLIADGDVSISEAKSKLSGSDYAKAADKLKKAHELFLERSAAELQKQMEDNNELISVHWFYGESETGKSYLAESLARESGLPFYKSTTTTDPFQFYQAEQVIILDELRPEMIPYSELLALFNPFSKGRVAVSSRYFNKELSCNTIYITTPYNPVEFFKTYKTNRWDTGEQLFRRLSSVLMFDMDYIFKMEFCQQYYKYLPIDKKENRYSKKHQQSYVLDNIFDKIQ